MAMQSEERKNVQRPPFAAPDAPESRRCSTSRCAGPQGQALTASLRVPWNRRVPFDATDTPGLLHDRIVVSTANVSEALPPTPLDEALKNKAFEPLARYGVVSGLPPDQAADFSVGIAIGCRWQSHRFRCGSFKLPPANVYAIFPGLPVTAGAGREAPALAARRGLANLCWLALVDHAEHRGDAAAVRPDEAASWFDALGWHVTRAAHVGVWDAIHSFDQANRRPTLMLLTLEGKGASPARTAGTFVRGSAIHAQTRGAANLQAVWRRQAIDRCNPAARLRRRRRITFDLHRRRHPQHADMLERMSQGLMPDAWDQDLPNFTPQQHALCLWSVCGHLVSTLSRNVPWLVEAASVVTASAGGRFESADRGAPFAAQGRELRWAARQATTLAIANGTAACGLRVWIAARRVRDHDWEPAMRAAGRAGVPMVFIFEEDAGATSPHGSTNLLSAQHTPCELIDGLVTIRPADANELVEAWKVVLRLRDRPAALLLPAGAAKTLDRSRLAPAAGVARGGYVLAETRRGEAASRGGPRHESHVTLIGCGAQIGDCVEAQQRLEADGVSCRVVNMVSRELFEEQPHAYRRCVLPATIEQCVLGSDTGTTVWHCDAIGRAGAPWQPDGRARAVELLTALVRRTVSQSRMDAA